MHLPRCAGGKLGFLASAATARREMENMKEEAVTLVTFPAEEV